MTLGASRAAILGLVLESALWGFSVLMFGATLYLLCRGRSFSEVHLLNVTISVLFFFLSTMHMVVMANRVLAGFLSASPNEYFSHIQRSTVYMGSAYLLQTMLGDAVVIYRCYVVWQNVWVVVVPLALWFGMAGVAFHFIHVLNMMANGKHALFHNNIWPCLFFSLSLGTNILATFLLAYRILQVNRKAASSQMTVMDTRIRPILKMAVDAAFLYTILLIAAIVNATSKSNDTILVVNLLVPSISIIFYMVIMRIVLAQAAHRSSSPTAITPTNTGFTTTTDSCQVSRDPEHQLTTVEMEMTEGSTHMTEHSKEGVRMRGMH